MRRPIVSAIILLVVAMTLPACVYKNSPNAVGEQTWALGEVMVIGA